MDSEHDNPLMPSFSAGFGQVEPAGVYSLQQEACKAEQHTLRHCNEQPADVSSSSILVSDTSNLACFTLFGKKRTGKSRHHSSQPLQRSAIGAQPTFKHHADNKAERLPEAPQLQGRSSGVQSSSALASVSSLSSTTHSQATLHLVPTALNMEDLTTRTPFASVSAADQVIKSLSGSRDAMSSLASMGLHTHSSAAVAYAQAAAAAMAAEVHHPELPPPPIMSMAAAQQQVAVVQLHSRVHMPLLARETRVKPGMSSRAPAGMFKSLLAKAKRLVQLKPGTPVGSPTYMRASASPRKGPLKMRIRRSKEPRGLASLSYSRAHHISIAAASRTSSAATGGALSTQHQVGTPTCRSFSRGQGSGTNCSSQGGSYSAPCPLATLHSSSSVMLEPHYAEPHTTSSSSQRQVQLHAGSHSSAQHMEVSSSSGGPCTPPSRQGHHTSTSSHETPHSEITFASNSSFSPLSMTVWQGSADEASDHTPVKRSTANPHAAAATATNGGRVGSTGQRDVQLDSCGELLPPTAPSKRPTRLRSVASDDLATSSISFPDVSHVLSHAPAGNQFWAGSHQCGGSGSSSCDSRVAGKHAGGGAGRQADAAPTLDTRQHDRVGRWAVGSQSQHASPVTTSPESVSQYVEPSLTSFGCHQPAAQQMTPTLMGCRLPGGRQGSRGVAAGRSSPRKQLLPAFSETDEGVVQPRRVCSSSGAADVGRERGWAYPVLGVASEGHTSRTALPGVHLPNIRTGSAGSSSRAAVQQLRQGSMGSKGSASSRSSGKSVRFADDVHQPLAVVLSQPGKPYVHKAQSYHSSSLQTPELHAQRLVSSATEVRPAAVITHTPHPQHGSTLHNLTRVQPYRPPASRAEHVLHVPQEPSFSTRYAPQPTSPTPHRRQTDAAPTSTAPRLQEHSTRVAAQGPPSCPPRAACVPRAASASEVLHATVVQKSSKVDPCVQGVPRSRSLSPAPAAQLSSKGLSVWRHMLLEDLQQELEVVSATCLASTAPRKHRSKRKTTSRTHNQAASTTPAAAAGVAPPQQDAAHSQQCPGVDAEAIIRLKPSSSSKTQGTPWWPQEAGVLGLTVECQLAGHDVCDRARAQDPATVGSTDAVMGSPGITAAIDGLGDMVLGSLIVTEPASQGGTTTSSDNASVTTTTTAAAEAESGSVLGASDAQLVLKQTLLQFAIQELLQLDQLLEQVCPSPAQAEELQAQCMVQVLSAVEQALEASSSTGLPPDLPPLMLPGLPSSVGSSLTGMTADKLKSLGNCTAPSPPPPQQQLQQGGQHQQQQQHVVPAPVHLPPSTRASTVAPGTSRPAQQPAAAPPLTAVPRAKHTTAAVPRNTASASRSTGEVRGPQLAATTSYVPMLAAPGALPPHLPSSPPSPATSSSSSDCLLTSGTLLGGPYTYSSRQLCRTMLHVNPLAFDEDADTKPGGYTPSPITGSTTNIALIPVTTGGATAHHQDQPVLLSMPATALHMQHHHMQFQVPQQQGDGSGGDDSDVSEYVSCEEHEVEAGWELSSPATRLHHVAVHHVASPGVSRRGTPPTSASRNARFIHNTARGTAAATAAAATGGGGGGDGGGGGGGMVASASGRAVQSLGSAEQQSGSILVTADSSCTCVSLSDHSLSPPSLQLPGTGQRRAAGRSRRSSRQQHHHHHHGHDHQSSGRNVVSSGRNVAGRRCTPRTRTPGLMMSPGRAGEVAQPQRAAKTNATSSGGHGSSGGGGSTGRGHGSTGGGDSAGDVPAAYAAFNSVSMQQFLATPAVRAALQARHVMQAVKCEHMSQSLQEQATGSVGFSHGCDHVIHVTAPSQPSLPTSSGSQQVKTDAASSSGSNKADVRPCTDTVTRAPAAGVAKVPPPPPPPPPPPAPVGVNPKPKKPAAPGPPPPPPPPPPPAPLNKPAARATGAIQPATTQHTGGDNQAPAASARHSSMSQQQQQGSAAAIHGGVDSTASKVVASEVTTGSPPALAAAAPTITRYPSIITLHQDLRKALLGAPVAKSAADKKVGQAGVPAGLPVSRDQLLGEITRRSGYYQQVAQDAHTHRGLLEHWARHIAHHTFSSMQEVVQAVADLDIALSSIDEHSVIQHCTKTSGFVWPESRCDALRTAAALHKDLTTCCTHLTRCTLTPGAPLSQELSRLTRQHERVVQRVDDVLRDKDKLTARFKDHHIPWDWRLVDRVKAAALAPLTAFLQAVLQAVTPTLATPGSQWRQQQVGQQVLSPELKQVLNGAVGFAFRVHQFTGGFDAACAAAADKLRPLWYAHQ